MPTRVVMFLLLSGLATQMALPRASGQAQARQQREVPGVLTKHIDGFRIEGQALVDALLELGKAAQQPFGVEYIKLEGLRKPTSVSMAPGTLVEGLRTVLAGHKGYSWRLEDSVVVIGPETPTPRAENPLNLVLPDFSIHRCTLQEASHQLDMALEARLHPGVGTAGEYEPGLAGSLVGPLQMKNATVRQVLNRLVREAGHAAWVAQVLPTERSGSPSSGVWLIVEYNDVQRMGRVAQLIIRARYPLGISPPAPR